MAECKIYRRQMDEAADGGLVSGDARSHFSSCRACGDELRERANLRALVGGMGKVEAPADFDFRLRARMAASKTGGGRGLFKGSRWLYGFAPVAIAACFVVVSATLYFRQAARKAAPAPPAVANATAPAPNVEQNRNPATNPQSRPAEPAAQTKSAEVASAAIHKPARDLSQRVRHARAVAPRGERRVETAQQNTFINSVTGARVITRIPVKASAEPLRIILRDERGTGRVVPVRSVSFGSQDFLAREAAVRSSVASEVGGVW